MSFNNHIAASNFVTNTDLVRIGMKAYIPDHFVQRFYGFQQPSQTVKVGIIHNGPVYEAKMF